MPAFDLDQIRHGKIIEWTVAYITAGEATMRLIHLTTTVALVLSVSPATAQVQWRVTPEDVRLACQAMRQDTSQVLQQSITGSLKRFCNLSLGGWDAWADTTIRFSIGDSIVAWANVARRQAQEAVQSLTTGLGQPNLPPDEE